MKLKRWLKLVATLSVPVLFVIFICHWLVARSASGRLFDAVSSVPDQRVGLVLGCSKKLRNGRDNLFFKTRIRAAVELFKAGKVKTFIVSGDNHREGYDEPTDMKDALIAEGIPDARVYPDYAGFRTLDSIVRAKRVFGQDKLTIISQRFHNGRAVYLARANGIDAIAFNAPDVRLESAVKTYLREAFARVKAVLDVHVLHTQPKFLGEPVKMPD